jgi:hypothetical protein
MGGMRVTEYRAGDGGVETILEGCLQDQAALCGVLNTLYELHVPVLMVERLESETP